jgi:hypothetical protein
MNKRIKGLAEQAGFVLWQDEPWRPTDVIDWSVRYDDELEKFAELIVKDCAKFADKGNRGGTGELMKKHFGVKE